MPMPGQGREEPIFPGVPSLDHQEVKHRLDANQELLDRLVAWLYWEAAQRTLQRSWGEQAVRITWQDGRAAVGHVEPSYTVKQASPGGQLPGEKE